MLMDLFSLQICWLSRAIWEEERFSKSKSSSWGNDYIQSSNLRTRLALKGGQNGPPQNAPLWHEDHFELKAFENQQLQEEFPAFPSAWRQGCLSLRGGGPLCVHRRGALLPPETELALSELARTDFTDLFSSPINFLVTSPHLIVFWTPSPLSYVKMVYKPPTLVTKFHFPVNSCAHKKLINLYSFLPVNLSFVH